MQYLIAQANNINGTGEDVDFSLVDKIADGGSFVLLAIIVLAALYGIPKAIYAFMSYHKAVNEQVSADRHASNNALHSMSLRIEAENEKQRAHDFACLQKEREICDKHFDKLSMSLEKASNNQAEALNKLSDSHLLLADTVRAITTLVKKDSHA